MEHIRGSGTTECIFHNQHKTLYNIFSPGQAVSCVVDKQVSYREIYTLCSILLISFRSRSVVLAMDAFTWDNWILSESLL